MQRCTQQFTGFMLKNPTWRYLSTQTIPVCAACRNSPPASSRFCNGLCALSTYKESPRKLKPRFGLRVNCGRHVARLHHRRRRRRRRRRAYAPTSNTASHDTHEKISSWVPFSFLIWVWGSAWRPSAAGAPLLYANRQF